MQKHFSVSLFKLSSRNPMQSVDFKKLKSKHFFVSFFSLSLGLNENSWHFYLEVSPTVSSPFYSSYLCLLHLYVQYLFQQSVEEIQFIYTEHYGRPCTLLLSPFLITQFSLLVAASLGSEISQRFQDCSVE